MTIRSACNRLYVMTRRTKLFDKIKNNPTGVTFAEIETLLLREGFELDRIAGSHHVFIRGDITFVIPRHGKQVKSIYVKRVIELLSEDFE